MKALTALFVLLLWARTSVLAETNSPAKPKGKQSPVLFLFPACPCYQVVGAGTGETLIAARVDGEALAGATMRVQLLDGSGASLETETADASQGGIVEVKVKVPVEKKAKFGVMVRLMDAHGKELAKRETGVVVEAPGVARVVLGADGYLVVGGKREFPIGLYSAIMFEKIASVGFDVVHRYDIVNGAAEDKINTNDMALKELLDHAWSLGMRVMVELPRSAVEKAAWDSVKRRIETFKHHPGLLAWDSEERVARGKTTVATLDALYKLVHELDPDHPFVLGDSRDLSKRMEHFTGDFFPSEAMDIGVWWWYSFPKHTNAMEMEIPTWLTNGMTPRPLWIAVQAYRQPWQHSRYPTEAEYRSEVYLSIIHGVKGIFFYTGSGEKDYLKRPAGLLNQMEDSHWSYVQTLVREMKQMTPVYMAPVVTNAVTMAAANAPVDFTVRQLDGSLYLIAANRSNLPQTVRFNGAALKGHEIETLYERHPVTVEGETLSDDFDSYGVHVYKIK